MKITHYTAGVDKLDAKYYLHSEEIIEIGRKSVDHLGWLILGPAVMTLNFHRWGIKQNDSDWLHRRIVVSRWMEQSNVETSVGYHRTDDV